MKKLFTTFLMVALCAFVANAQGIGWVKVTTGVKSKGASLYVDGKYVSDIPATVALTEGTHKVVLKKTLYLDQEMNITVQANKIVDVGVDLIKNYSDVKITSVTPAALIYIDGTYVGKGNDMTLPILYGEHKIKVTHPEYKAYEGVMTVTSKTSYLKIPALEPRIGYLVVNKNMADATVKVYGQYQYQGPESNIRVGKYTVVVTKPGYTKYTETVYVTEGKTTTVNASIEKLYSLSIDSDISNPKIKIDGVEYTEETYPREVVSGEYEVSVEAEGFKTRTKKIKYPEQESILTHYFHLPEYLFYHDDYFYFGFGVQAMRYAGLKFDIGGYISNVNVELNYISGFRRAAVGPVGIYVDEGYEEPTYYEYNYKPKNYWGIMAGYGVKMGTRMRLTPQVGIGVLSFKTKKFSQAFNEFFYDEDTEDEQKTGYEKFRTGALNFAAKFDIGLVYGVALYLTPGYTYGFAGKNTVASTVMGIYPHDIRTKYASGFNLSLGVSLYF